MSKLWNKTNSNTHPKIESYTVGKDYLLDMTLLPFDIGASKAHAKGLMRIGILSQKEFFALSKALTGIFNDWKAGKLAIRVEDEDCHTLIENLLIDKLGNTGKKIHTGRSRNDQVLVALRLYALENLRELTRNVLELSNAFLLFSDTHKKQPLPGYTHTQQAMLSSVGHWGASFLEALLDDAELMRSVSKHLSANPLGSAAGFGVSFELDRKFTTKELNFDRLQINSLYCQSSRPKFDSLLLEALSQLMMTLGRFAADMLLFTSREFDFFELPDDLVTGSSIMPQKKNHDALEILRANLSVVNSHQDRIRCLSKGLISGYHRDYQLLKPAIMESVELCGQSIDIVSLYVAGIKPKAEQIHSKICKDIFAADEANALVKDKGLPFREAYKQALSIVEGKSYDLAGQLSQKRSVGSPGNLGLKGHAKRIQALRKSKG